MLRFSEPELISGVLLEPKTPNLISFSWESEVSEMPKESLFPLLPSSLHINNFGSKESLVLNPNVSSDRLNNYSDSFPLNAFSSLPSLNPIQGQASMATDQPVELKKTNSQYYNAMVEVRKQIRKHTMDQTSTPENKRRKSGSRGELLKSQGTAKKSQKLGDKITALQQLVSPFGKTDTASVLHEASSYIKFLQEQIRVLSSPYFGTKTSPGLLGNVGGDLSLQQRGLCLVPISEDLRNQVDPNDSFCRGGVLFN